MVRSSETLREMVEQVRQQGVPVAYEVPSAPKVTYRAGGAFAAFAMVGSVHALQTLGKAVAQYDIPVVVLGRGSNFLVADSGFPGLAVQLDPEEFGMVHAKGAEILAGGATPLPVLARRSAALGRHGLEFFVGIPGTVGGAVRMNAGGHGRETAEVLVCAQVLSLDTGVIQSITGEQLQFAYRTSALSSRDVVIEATFSTEPDQAGAAVTTIEEIVRWRREHQPGGANAGSVFRNPPGDSAGRLIEAAGCKGMREGGAVISPKHANFIQGESGATAADIITLGERARAAVLAQFGIELQWELQRIGFEEDN